MTTKIKSDTIFLLIEVLIDTFRKFIYILFLVVNKSQPILNIYQEITKTFYDDYGKSVSTTIKFSSKKLFFDLSIFTN